MAVEVAVTVGLVLLVATLLLVIMTVRWVRHFRNGGIDVALRSRPDQEGSRWLLGVGRYHGEEFAWYRVTSLRSGPHTVVRRSGLTIVSRRAPAGSEAYAMPTGATVLRCRARDGEFELAMAPDAMTGFLSWLESAPPGRAVPWAS